MKIIKNEPATLAEKSCRISRYLRHPQTVNEKRINSTIKKPFKFYPKELIGELAVFIFGSFQCNKFLQGTCVPCFYSGFPHSKKQKKDIYNALLKQTKYILNNFNKLVIKHQKKNCYEYNLYRRFKNKGLNILLLTGEGSFFADHEIPQAYRNKILNSVWKHALKNKLNLQVQCEAKAEDILNAEKKGEFKEYKKLAKDLNLTLEIGLESANDFSRNTIYAKDLQLKDFEKAINITKKHSLITDAFVFCGFHSMTEKEILDDVKKTIDYLREKNIGIRLMFPNIQRHTINHLLYHYKKYNLIDIRTARELIRYLIFNNNKNNYNYIKGQDWILGGLVSNPTPLLTIFNNPNALSCKKCCRMFEQAIYKLVKTYDPETFERYLKQMKKCKCEKKYQAFLSQAPKKPLQERVKNNLEFADKLKKDYLALKSLKTS